MNLTLRILGIRGVPAAHGGFETFAERLALHLVDRGWRVVVYCQEADGQGIWTDHWQGVERVHIPVSGEGAVSTMRFDWLSIADAAKYGDLCLTLGYNTASFCARLRWTGVRNIINMDGIEWSRAKWSIPAKVWLWLNERAGCWLGDLLIADHPEIANHLGRRTSRQRIVTIPYGADRIEDGDPRLVTAQGLSPGEYVTVIARPEPENSLLEIVGAWSARPRGVQLAVLGRYDAANAYHRSVQAAASDEVKFLGPIYDRATVASLRYHSRAYIHGHRVGGTNPSLVEALGAGNPVIAHDNPFNRWVAGPASKYFKDESALSGMLDELLVDRGQLAQMSLASRARHESGLTWPAVLESYEQALSLQLRGSG